MKLIKHLVAAAALTAMATTPALAQSAASKLSLTRATTPAAKASKIHGTTAIVAILALSAVIGGTIIAVRSKSKPASP